MSRKRKAKKEKLKKLIKDSLAKVIDDEPVNFGIHDRWNPDLIKVSLEPLEVEPTTIYLSMDGDDSNDGLSEEKPIRSLEKLNSIVYGVPMEEKSCANCAKHSVEQVPARVEESFDEYVEFSDETVDSYICMAGETPIGIGKEPKTGDQIKDCYKEPAKKEALSEADKAVARFEARMKRKGKS